ncbi:MAG: 3-dehydroquinate synthase [Simkaniaceae bacterium]
MKERFFSLTPPKVEFSLHFGSIFSSRFIEHLSSYKRIAIITDTTVRELYGNSFKNHLISSGFDAYLFAFTSGEERKNRNTKQEIETFLFENHHLKEDLILGFGGGVVLDIAGFLAATFLRGSPFILLPTTLLAMSDACFGGKTGVNTPFGKNLIGSLAFPKALWIDTQMLLSLKEAQLFEGAVEMIKHALILDHSLFSQMEASPYFYRNAEGLCKWIEKSLLLKAQIVTKDPFEQGIRKLLNFGHTIGHALEKVFNYQISHGQSVGIGLMAESCLSYLEGDLDTESYKRIIEFMLNFKENLIFPSLPSVEALFEYMSYDKKARKGTPRFVLLKSIGNPVEANGEFCHTVSQENLQSTIKLLSNGQITHFKKCYQGNNLSPSL